MNGVKAWKGTATSLRDLFRKVNAIDLTEGMRELLAKTYGMDGRVCVSRVLDGVVEPFCTILPVMAGLNGAYDMLPDGKYWCVRVRGNERTVYSTERFWGGHTSCFGGKLKSFEGLEQPSLETLVW